MEESDLKLLNIILSHIATHFKGCKNGLYKIVTSDHHNDLKNHWNEGP
jgi:hypothetical protein